MNRLDHALVERSLCESREKARRLILAGSVRINQRVARKASEAVRPEDSIELAAGERYVSRGGLKLEHALHRFRINPPGWVAVDLGASTGGFTDCLLQHGVSRVYAVDVGRGQLAWKLRQDPRVVVMEKTNARHLHPGDFPPPFTPVDLVTIDCSFISIRQIIPAASGLLRAGGWILALIKPQFEAGKAEADRGRGVIKDAAVHERIVRELETLIGATPALRWRGVIESPLLGPAGNKEFLSLIEKAA